MQKIIGQLATEIKIRPDQVQTAVSLLDGGATVPFIARYRKEVTGGLDDIQLRELEYRLGYLRELEERRATILKSISDQGKLSPELHLAIEQAATKQDLEDLYLPFKPKRRTKGMIAKEAGIEPLADALWANPALNPQDEAQAYLKPADAIEGADFSTVGAVLDGVRDILSERWAEDASLVQALREWLWKEGLLTSRLASGKDENQAEVAKFRDYFDYSEPMGRVPSHRALAVFRGRALEFLDAKLSLPEPEAMGNSAASLTATAAAQASNALAEGRIALHLGWSHKARASDDLLRKTILWTWRVKLSLSLERDLFARLREEAEKVAIKVFADNLRDLLLAAPAGPRVVLGLDPGIRTGVKVAVVDATGKLIETATVYPHEPRRDWDGSLHTLNKLCSKHGVNLIAIGNGTASRETEAFVKKLKLPASIPVIMVNESGASIYSASDVAREEFPNEDVTVRGAVSIGRRLMDPLAELVKIDPKSIGVGQYQHDVEQRALKTSLDDTVISCVNAVGVELNTASKQLLSYVSGLNSTLAENIVAWRNDNGAFQSRDELKKVPRLGEKAFEQAAGFLRVRGGKHPLDASAVHPERYTLVERMAADAGCATDELIGNEDARKKIDLKRYVSENVGLPTLQDIINELAKPGRDPRKQFELFSFQEGVDKPSDLQPGMKLPGIVTNVTAFGAFVDIGVHQDGLVHVSQLADHFVRDASEVVKVGQKVQITVVEVDLKRNRIALSMKSKPDLENRRSNPEDRTNQNQTNRRDRPSGNQGASNNDWFSQAMQHAKKK